jgi:hypothetical protein
MFSIKNENTYFEIDQEEEKFLKIKGTTDVPGVLASGSVASGGVQSNTWGAKVNDSNITPSGGSYTIPHNIGNTKYSVQITPRTASRVGYVATKNTNSVVVVLTNTSGSGVNTDFDYMIVGNN